MSMRKTIAAASSAALAGVGAIGVNASAVAKQSATPNTQDASQHSQIAQCSGEGKCGAKM